MIIQRIEKKIKNTVKRAKALFTEEELSDRLRYHLDGATYHRDQIFGHGIKIKKQVYDFIPVFDVKKGTVLSSHVELLKSIEENVDDIIFYATVDYSC
jgi:hypothetical protein